MAHLFMFMFPAAALVVVNTLMNIPVGLLLLPSAQTKTRAWVALWLLVVNSHNVSNAVESLLIGVLI